MKSTVNTFFAMLIVTIFGSWAALAIVEIATTDIIASATQGSINNYAALQQSILKSR